MKLRIEYQNQDWTVESLYTYSNNIGEEVTKLLEKGKEEIRIYNFTAQFGAFVQDEIETHLA